jgi:hypothetical protein
MAEAGLRGQECAVQVDCEHLLPLTERKLVDRLHYLDAGIADEDINTAEARGGSGDAGFDRRLVAHVHGDAQRDATCSADLIRGRLRRRQLQISDYHLCAFESEAFGDLLADAARGAGDDGNFAF